MESVKDYYLRKAASRRAASYWIGFGGVGSCLLALAIWYVIRVAINHEIFHPGPVLKIPTEVLIVLIAAVVFVIIAVVLRIMACRAANIAAEIGDVEDIPIEAEEDEEEEPAVYAETAEEAEAVSEPVDEEAEAVEEEVSETAVEPAEEAAEEAVEEEPVEETAVEEVPAEDGSAEEEAPQGRIAAARAAILKRAERTFSDEVYGKIKTTDEAIDRSVAKAKKNAKLLLPAAIAVFAIGAAVAGSVYKSRMGHERAKLRRNLYKWLG